MGKLKEKEIQKVIALRHALHRHPETAFEEVEAARLLKEFIIHHSSPDDVIEGLGGHGVAFVFNSAEPHGETAGKTVLLRAELDALPIQEESAASHRSVLAGKAHMCGHDGHMAGLAAVAMQLSKSPPKNGRVVLLFQPAEEVGLGMEAVVKDPKFDAIMPDIAVSLHNIPGLPLGDVITKAGPFSSSVESMEMDFGNGNYREAVIAEAIAYMEKFNTTPEENEGLFVRASLTHANNGNGGKLNTTIRARTPEKLAEVKQALNGFIEARIAHYNALPPKTEKMPKYEQTLTVKFAGSTAHAAEPEMAANPGIIMADIFAHHVQGSEKLTLDSISIGAPKSHGITAGKGAMDVTVHADTQEELTQLCDTLMADIRHATERYNQQLPEALRHAGQQVALTIKEGSVTTTPPFAKLSAPIRYHVDVVEAFKANINDPELVEFVRQAAAQNGVPFHEQKTPNNWAEDFGALRFFVKEKTGKSIASLMFGHGAGENQLPLHNPSYDYPDALLNGAADMFMGIMKGIWEEEEREKPPKLRSY